MAGETEHGVGPDQFARIARRQIVLAHVQARAQQQGEIGAIVHHQPAPASGQSRAICRAASNRARPQCPLCRICSIPAPPSSNAAAAAVSSWIPRWDNSSGVEDGIDPWQMHLTD